MSMSASTLGAAMHAAWNSVQPDTATINMLGDTMYDYVMAVYMGQDSVANGTIGRQRFREMAKAILQKFYNTSGATSAARWQAVANAIISHISSNATIAPLSTSESPNDGPAHIHSTKTVSSTGKIS